MTTTTRFLYAMYRTELDKKKYIHLVVVNEEFWDKNKTLQQGYGDPEAEILHPLIVEMGLYQTWCSTTRGLEFELVESATEEGVHEKLSNDPHFTVSEELAKYVMEMVEKPIDEKAAEKAEEELPKEFWMSVAKNLKFNNWLLLNHIHTMQNAAKNKIEAETTVIATCDEDGDKKEFILRATYTDSRTGKGFGKIDLNPEEDLNKDDVQKIVDWINSKNEDLKDFVITGKAYEITNKFFGHFAIWRFALDQLHAEVLDAQLEHLQKFRDAVHYPRSLTR